jgi:aromatic-L-amino-acid/L-tryptophan decarboxylase
MHVDTAYAGSAAVCPEFRGYLDSAELADLVSMNPHTWFLTNADYYCLWVARPHDLTSALSTDTEYLKNVVSADGDAKDATNEPAAIGSKDWPISLSRRF